MKGLVALSGLVLCVCGMGLLWVGSSLFADARSERLAGPGLSAWILDRWPTPGSIMRLEVEAHGGDRAGIESVRVLLEGQEVARQTGGGVKWGNTISSSKSRGAETVELAVPIPADAVPGRPLQLELQVAFICAMSSASTFENESFSEKLGLTVAPVAATDSIGPRALYLVNALGLLVCWAAVIFGVLRLLKHPAAQSDGESMGIAIIGLAICAGILGFWGFARPLAATLGNPPALDYLLTVGWVVGVPVVMWRRSRVTPR